MGHLKSQNCEMTDLNIDRVSKNKWHEIARHQGKYIFKRSKMVYFSVILDKIIKLNLIYIERCRQFF